jgi:integrase
LVRKSQSQTDNSISNARALRVLGGGGGTAPARRGYGAPVPAADADPSAGGRDRAIEALAREWLVNLRVEGRSSMTLRWYRHHIDAYLAAGGVTLLSRLDAPELRRYICELQDRGLSDNSVRGAFLTLKCMCNWSAREGYAVDAGLLRVKTPRVAEKELATYNEHQLAAVLSQAPPGWPQLAVRILAGTGLRISELCDLGLEDFEDDGEAAFLKVRRGKGAKFRRVPLSHRLRRDVIRWCNHDRPETAHQRLLATRSREGVEVGAVTRMLARLSDRVGFRVHAHRFRHTFATEYLRNDGSMERLRKILGHSSYQMVLRYVHLDRSDLSRDFSQRSPY